MYKLSIQKHVLDFIIPAKTSRGEYYDRTIWLLTLLDIKTGKSGVGEIAPLLDLSSGFDSLFEQNLENWVSNFNATNNIQQEFLNIHSSIKFGYECAYSQLLNSPNYFYSNFTSNKYKIPVNGLVWMNSEEEMKRQITEKIREGYTCIKIKIGAIDFDAECRVLEFARKQQVSYLELRADANGGFLFDDIPSVFKELTRFNLHSIEQPIKQKQYEKMEELCAKSSIKIALDEDLIGLCPLNDFDKIKKIKPDFIILKPTLHGGISGCNDWIKKANLTNINWWATSALESNIGLNAIAQWVALYEPKSFQGLGTGKLFKDNFNSQFTLEKGCVTFKKK